MHVASPWLRNRMRKGAALWYRRTTLSRTCKRYHGHRSSAGNGGACVS